MENVNLPEVKINLKGFAKNIFYSLNMTDLLKKIFFETMIDKNNQCKDVQKLYELTEFDMTYSEFTEKYFSKVDMSVLYLKIINDYLEGFQEYQEVFLSNSYNYIKHLEKISLINEKDDINKTLLLFFHRFITIYYILLCTGEGKNFSETVSDLLYEINVIFTKITNQNIIQPLCYYNENVSKINLIETFYSGEHNININPEELPLFNNIYKCLILLSKVHFVDILLK